MSEHEQWRSIHGYSRLYLASDAGRIISTKTGREIRPQIGRGGYYTVNLYDGYAYRCMYVHRIVAECYSRRHRGRVQVNHIDGNKLNNRASNLEWVTPSENAKHSFAIGRSKPARGSKHCCAVLTEEAVILMRTLRQHGAKTGYLASRFGVCQQTVSDVCNGRTWSWLSQKTAA